MNHISVRPVHGAVAFSLLAGLLLAAPCRAQDFIYGGDARAFSMGGSGVALMQSRSSRPNPATLAFERKNADPTFPTLGFRASGPISRDAGGGFLVNGLENKDATAIARDYGTGDSDFGVTGGLAFRYGQVELGASAVGLGRLQPNAALRKWSQTSKGDFESLPANAKADIYAGGYYNVPTISYGQSIPTTNLKDYQVGVGVRMKYMTGMYTHYVPGQRALLGLDPAALAPEMEGKERITKTGIGADLGIMIRPRKGEGISGALVIANAVRPNFAFDGTDRDGNPTRVNLIRTTFTAGIGYQNKYGTTAAVDVVDFTGAAGKAELRAGVEQRVWGPIYVRGGYNSTTGGTAGVSFYGLDIAVSQRMPLEVVKTVSF